MPDPERRTRIDETDAKAGSKEGVVRWVLLVSLALAIIALTIIWVTGALTQGPVESQMNVERKVDARTDQADENDDLAEEADLVSPGTPQEAKDPGPKVVN
jgi:hypothetical protein